MADPTAPIEEHALALPESALAALYGMVDVLPATGTLWLELTGDAPGGQVRACAKTGRLDALIVARFAELVRPAHDRR